MNRPKKKELTAAERWKENNGSALMIIGLGLAIVGASVTRLHMISKRDEPSEPATFGRDFAGEPSPSHLLIKVQGFPSDLGVCQLTVYGRMPNRSGLFTTVARLELPIAERSAEAVVPSLRPGMYYVDAYHDINNNSRLDTDLSPEPERYGFSNEAPGTIDDPDIEKAQFAADVGEQSILFHVR